MPNRIARPGSLLLAVLATLSCGPRPGSPAGPPPDQLAGLEEKRLIAAPGGYGVEGFSPAVKVGKRIYVSGQVGVDSTGAVAGDLQAQAQQALHNLQAVLLAAGATPEDVVQLDVHVVDPGASDLAGLHTQLGGFFAAGGLPAGNLVGVASLARPGLRVSLAAVAETRGLFPDREALRRYR